MLSENARDIGSVKQGQKLSQRFDFRNEGRVPLRIEGIRTDCGCTWTLLSGDVIQPGRTGTIDVSVDTFADSGRVDRSVTVRTNDPARRNLVLALAATVVPEFAVDVNMLDFGESYPNETVQRSIRVTRLPGAAPIISVRSTDPAVTATMEGRWTGRDSVEIVATRSRATIARHHWGNLEVATQSAAMPLIRIPIRGVIQNPR